MLRTIIVEDEPLSRLYLNNLLTECFEDVEIIGYADNEDEAIQAIGRQSPDLVFLDIELQTGSGFGVANRLPGSGAHIVFTTALDQYATNLLRLAGVPYIPKPIDAESLRATVDAARDPRSGICNAVALEHLRNTIRNNGRPVAVRLSAGEQPEYVDLANIICIEAAGMQSALTMYPGGKRLIAIPLKELDDMLQEAGFFRPHMQYIINLARIGGRLDEGNSLLPMGNDIKVPVSPKKLDELRRIIAG